MSSSQVPKGSANTPGVSQRPKSQTVATSNTTITSQLSRAISRSSGDSWRLKGMLIFHQTLTFSSFDSPPRQKDAAVVWSV
jgi:hypothetical protein